MTDADHLLGLFKSAHLAGLGRAAHTAANATSPARKYEQRRRASGSASTPVLFLTLYPAETDGGGERFLFNAALSALEAGAEVHLACLDRSIVGRQPGTEFARTGVYFATSADQFAGVKPLAFRDLLNMLELYEHVYVGQYLGSSLIFDILARVAPEQQLYLVNLGFEPFASEFWDSYRVAPNHHFTAISKYAASRIPERIPGRRTESAALWRHETAPRTPMATSDSQICVVGRMLPHKGFETAIRATPEGVRTIIIGDLSHDDEQHEPRAQRATAHHDRSHRISRRRHRWRKHIGSAGQRSPRRSCRRASDDRRARRATATEGSGTRRSACGLALWSHVHTGVRPRARTDATHVPEITGVWPGASSCAAYPRVVSAADCLVPALPPSAPAGH